MEKVELNLTRKWRSKNFQEVVGQPLAIRILQNSLYLKQFFPVYLFAGQRGCGKTSTARIFAAAVNCARLPEFQQDPRKVSIPCLLCSSCCAMSSGQHPDFIEIDAASHTGVDNVRNIIDASSFLPLLGQKKIYLIDEAHMLSKAAFNAFLKILEEPPMSVIFILATTDMQKILETVKSRCFQIFFDAVDQQVIADHLEKLCIAENIAFESSGLAVIAQQAGGSVRDGINLLEQVRFATKKISKESVLSVLGYVDEATLLQLFFKITQEDVHGFLLASTALEKYELSIEYIWAQLTDLVYDAILLQYKVEPRQFTHLSDACKKEIIKIPLDRLTRLFAVLSGQEQNIARTTKKLRFFQMILLQYVQQDDSQESKKKIKDLIVDQLDQQSEAIGLNEWHKFIDNIKKSEDLVLVTMFQDAQFVGFDAQKSVVSISFLKKFMMFQDVVEKERKNWSILLQQQFGNQVQLQWNFETIAKQQAPTVIVDLHVAKPVPNVNLQSKVKEIVPELSVQANSVSKLDLSDGTTWKLAQELMKHFDGVITEISRDKV